MPAHLDTSQGERFASPRRAPETQSVCRACALGSVVVASQAGDGNANRKQQQRWLSGFGIAKRPSMFKRVTTA